MHKPPAGTPSNPLSSSGRLTVGKIARRTVKDSGKVKRVPRKIHTNLYELVETVMDEAGSVDSVLVTSVVLRMLGNAKAVPAHTTHTGH